MSSIQVSAEGAVRTLSFDRAAKKNAFTAEMYETLSAELQRAQTDEGVRVVLLKGASGVFTAGNDLSDFLANPPQGEASPVFQFLLSLAALDKPIVAAVQGVAIGVGTTMLLHCDHIVASETAKFALPFVNLGLSPEGASSLLLPLSAGHALASELLLFGDTFDVHTAQRAGLVSRVVPDAEVLTVAMSRAQLLASKPLAALMETKRLLRRQSRPQVVPAFSDEAKVFFERLASPEAKEAFSAFLERRAPDFTRR